MTFQGRQSRRDVCFSTKRLHGAEGPATFEFAKDTSLAAKKGLDPDWLKKVVRRSPTLPHDYDITGDRRATTLGSVCRP